MEIELRKRRKEARRQCDRDGHLLKVNRGVRTLFRLRWQPSPGSLLCHRAFDRLIRPPYLPVCLSATKAIDSEDKRVWMG